MCDASLDALSGWDVDYEYQAMDILDTINDAIAERMDDVEMNWDGDVDAIRAEVVAQMASDMEAEGTRTGRWQAGALLECYQEIYDEPLPVVP